MFSDDKLKVHDLSDHVRRRGLEEGRRRWRKKPKEWRAGVGQKWG